jgi:Peptidase_C39 like family
VLVIARTAGERTRIPIEPTTHAVVCWNTRAPDDTLEIIVHTSNGRRSLALPYVTFSPSERASLNGFDDLAQIEVDIVRARHPIVAIEVLARHPLERVAIATPANERIHRRTSDEPGPSELPVPALSQYDPHHPNERGWCVAASIAMLLAYWDTPRSLVDVVAATYDNAYRGTGNWTFALAYPGALGFTAVMAYLHDLRTVEGLVAAGIPVALSIAWEEGALPSAPLPRSSGHVLVVRGFDAAGNPIVNDPAQPDVRHVYARLPFEAVWLDHGGAALLVAPPHLDSELERLANL